MLSLSCPQGAARPRLLFTTALLPATEEPQQPNALPFMSARSCKATTALHNCSSSSHRRTTTAQCSPFHVRKELQGHDCSSQLLFFQPQKNHNSPMLSLSFPQEAARPQLLFTTALLPATEEPQQPNALPFMSARSCKATTALHNCSSSSHRRTTTAQCSLFHFRKKLQGHNCSSQLLFFQPGVLLWLCIVLVMYAVVMPGCNNVLLCWCGVVMCCCGDALLSWCTVVIMHGCGDVLL